MDFEKEYKNLVAKVKNAYLFAQTDSTKSVLEDILPQLRESEDERIRKWIIEELEITRDATSGKNPYSDDPDIVARLKRLDEAIDYLEKQKEQKSLNISAASEWLRKHVCTYMNSEYNEFHKCVEYDGSIDKERFINDFEEAMRKEQKPNFYEKDSTDFEIEVHEIIAQARNDSRLNDADVLKQFEEEAAFALMLKANKLIEQQKPAEWSKQQVVNALTTMLNERITPFHQKSLDGTIGDKEKMFMDAFVEMRSFINSSSFDIGKENSAEWSEEDSKRYISIGTTLETSIVLPKEDYDANMAWLRELVNAKKYHLRPSWKPSKDRSQMMEEAVECEVTETCGIPSVWIKTKQFKPGQKVRVIVLPKED